MGKKYLFFFLTAAVISVTACAEKKQEDYESESTSASSIAAESTNSEEDDQNNTALEVGSQLFSVDIPDFNVMPDGDIADKDGNTWLILQSETYENLTIQLTLHNKESQKLPENYSLDDFGLNVSETEEVQIHHFDSESIEYIEGESGEIYVFETENINGELLFFSTGQLTEKEKSYFDQMIESITITDL